MMIIFFIYRYLALGYINCFSVKPYFKPLLQFFKFTDGNRVSGVDDYWDYGIAWSGVTIEWLSLCDAHVLHRWLDAEDLLRYLVVFELIVLDLFQFILQENYLLLLGRNDAFFLLDVILWCYWIKLIASYRASAAAVSLCPFKLSVSRIRAVKFWKKPIVL